jgi:hypothetical protein
LDIILWTFRMLIPPLLQSFCSKISFSHLLAMVVQCLGREEMRLRAMTPELASSKRTPPEE